MRLRSMMNGVETVLLFLSVSGTVVLFPNHSQAQACGGSLASITYDTVVSSNLTGGNTAGGGFTFKIPKFPISALTLYAVDVKSTVSASAVGTVINGSSSSGSPTVELIRTDGFSSSATGNVGGTPSFSSFYTGGVIAPGVSEPVSLSNAIVNAQAINDSITTSSSSLMNFEGADSIAFSYTSNNIPLPAGNYFNIGTSVSDQVSFSITYYYCNPGPLATDIIAFTAVRTDDNTVSLN